MLRVFTMLGHFQFNWLCSPVHVFSGFRLCWTVAECLGNTYGPYVVLSIHNGVASRVDRGSGRVNMPKNEY